MEVKSAAACVGAPIKSVTLMDEFLKREIFTALSIRGLLERWDLQSLRRTSIYAPVCFVVQFHHQDTSWQSLYL